MYNKLLETFEKYKGQLVLCKLNMNVLRFIGFGKIGLTNYFYIYFNGDKIFTSEEGFIPLKNFIPEDEYEYLYSEHKKNSFDNLGLNPSENEKRAVIYRKRDLLKFKNKESKVLAKHWELS